MAIRRCPYCKAIIDESQKYCNNCGTQLLFPDDEPGEEPIKGEKIVDEDFPGAGEDRISDEFIDAPGEETDIDAEPEEEREEIDLEKVIEGEVPLEGKTGEDFGLIDLREAEPAPEEAGKEAEGISIEKPAAVEEISLPEIKVPESVEPLGIPEAAEPAEPVKSAEPSEPEEGKKARAARSLARRRNEDFVLHKPAEEDEGGKPKEKSLKLTAPHRGGGPGSPKIRDKDAKFEIARLIADFERRRREYTTDLEPPAEDHPPVAAAAEEPAAPPTEAELGEPPKPEELEKEAEALRTGNEGDFATDYEFVIEEKKPETGEPESLEARLARLVGGFNTAVESPSEDEADRALDTRHPEFMSGDLEEEAKPEEPVEPEPEKSPEEAPAVSEEHPSFVTEDLEEKLEAKGPLPYEPMLTPDREQIVLETRRAFQAEQRKEEPAPVPPPSSPLPPPPPPSTTADARSALIARILKQRAERLGLKEESRVSQETSEAFAALKSSTAAEKAKAQESFSIEQPEEPQAFEKPVETGEIQKLDLDELPPEEPEKTGGFQSEAWKTPGEDLPVIPTMGFPEDLPKTSPSLPFEAPPAEIVREPEPELEQEPELELRRETEPEPVAPPAPPPPPPVARNAVRRPEVSAAPTEAVAPAPQAVIAEPVEQEKPPAPAPVEPPPAPVVTERPPERPSVRAPVVKLGFFRRIKATIFDLLVVGAFWIGATALTSYFLAMPVLDLIQTAALPLGLLYLVLLVIYLFMFLLFLGETPGGRLVMPRE